MAAWDAQCECKIWRPDSARRLGHKRRCPQGCLPLAASQRLAGWAAHWPSGRSHRFGGAAQARRGGGGRAARHESTNQRTACCVMINEDEETLRCSLLWTGYFLLASSHGHVASACLLVCSAKVRDLQGRQRPHLDSVACSQNYGTRCRSLSVACLPGSGLQPDELPASSSAAALRRTACARPHSSAAAGKSK